MDKKLKKKLVKEVARCKRDFIYFSENYLYVIDKNNNKVKLKLNSAQNKILAELIKNNRLTILKARQLGSTTFIAAFLFWKTLFNTNERTAVIAHTRDAAESIFLIYKNFYNNLPQFLQFSTTSSNVREMNFKTGSKIKVGSASTESFRGSTYNNVHASEVGFWGDAEKTISSIFQTLTANPTIVLESTANGFNDFHKLWHDENGMSKLFLSWLDADDYLSSERPKAIPDQFKAYQTIPQKRLNWAIKTFFEKCAGNWAVFQQEYPITPEVAFITSGDRFFSIFYDNCQTFTGLKIYEPRQKYHIYTIGVDTASGSPNGDYSAFTLLDVTNKEKPRIAATYYDRISPHNFSALVQDCATKYEALVVCENNSYGLSVIERLVEMGQGLFYRTTKFNKTAGKWRDTIGYNTNSSTRPLLLDRFQRFIHEGKLQPICHRLQYEMNTFVYKDGIKPQADVGSHDDLIFATALALIGLEQISQVEQNIQKRAPANLKEMLEWENATGKVYKKNKHKFYDPMENSPLSKIGATTNSSQWGLD